MAEINTAGYQSIRDAIQASWKYIELRDGGGAAILRIGIGDARVTWTHVANAQTLELTVVIKGSDAGMVLPKTFASSALYSVSTAGSAYSVESFTPFTMEGTLDELTIKHQIQVPLIP